MTDTFYCPLGPGPLSPQKPPYNGEATWREDQTCSYCGSLHQDVFMARLEARDVALGPTDKSYKVYVENKGGAVFLQTYRNCPPDAKCTGPKDCTHWVTRDRPSTKFYFQHLTEPQMLRFIELLKAGKLKIDYPGHFYVTPFFISYKDPSP